MGEVSEVNGLYPCPRCNVEWPEEDTLPVAYTGV